MKYCQNCGNQLEDNYDKLRNTLTIYLTTPYDEDETEETTEKKTNKSEASAKSNSKKPKADNNTSNSSSSSNDDSIRKNIKAAIDSYEKFIDEYCDFLKNYDSSDLTQLSSYSEYFSKLAEMEEKFNKIKDKELNETELLYFAKVEARCLKKLAKTADSID